MEQKWSHNSNKQGKSMDLQLMRISKFHSLIISKKIGSILLLIYLITSMLLTNASVPAFYILAANNILPHLLTLVIKPKKEAEESILPLLAKKYKYTDLKYQSNSISSLIVCFMLFLWQRREFNTPSILGLLSLTPVTILFIMFMIRVCGNIYFRKKFHRMLIYSNF